MYSPSTATRAVALAVLLPGTLTLSGSGIVEASADPAANPLVAVSGEVAGVDQLEADSVFAFVTLDHDVEDELVNGEMVETVRLPGNWVATVGNHYEVTLDPRVLPPGLISDTGLVNFQILIQDPDTATFGITGSSSRAVVDLNGVVGWTNPIDAVDNASASTAAALAKRGVQNFTAKVATRFRPPVTSIDSLSTFGVLCDDEHCAQSAARHQRLRVNVGSPAVGDDDGGESPGGSVIIDEPDISKGGCPVGGAGDVYGTIRGVPTTIGTAYPRGDDTAWMHFTTGSAASFTSTLGVGFNDSVGSPTWSESSTETIERSGGFDWEEKSYARSFRADVKYQKVLHYYDRCPGDPPYFVTWEPVKYTGGFGENKGIDVPDFTNCVVVGSDGVWHRHISGGHSYQYDGAVKLSGVIGIDLSINRAYNAEARLSYRVNARKHMCGNNDDPLDAGKVMEKPYLF